MKHGISLYFSEQQSPQADISSPAPSLMRGAQTDFARQAWSRSDIFLTCPCASPGRFNRIGNPEEFPIRLKNSVPVHALSLLLFVIHCQDTSSVTRLHRTVQRDSPSGLQVNSVRSQSAMASSELFMFSIICAMLVG